MEDAASSNNNTSKDSSNDAVSSSINTSSSSSCCSDLVEQCFAALKQHPWDEDKNSDPRQTAKQQFAAKRKQQQQASPPRHQRRHTDLTTECGADAESPSLSPERKKKKRASRRGSRYCAAEPDAAADHHDFAAQLSLASTSSLADRLTGGPSDEEEEELPRPLLDVEDDDVDLNGSFQRQPAALLQEMDDVLDSKNPNQKQQVAIRRTVRSRTGRTSRRNKKSKYEHAGWCFSLAGGRDLTGALVVPRSSSSRSSNDGGHWRRRAGGCFSLWTDNDNEAVLVMKTTSRQEETLFPSPPPLPERRMGALDVVEKKEHVICGVAREADNDDAVMVETTQGALHSDERQPEKLRSVDEGDEQPATIVSVAANHNGDDCQSDVAGESGVARRTTTELLQKSS